MDEDCYVCLKTLNETSNCGGCNRRPPLCYCKGFTFNHVSYAALPEPEPWKPEDFLNKIHPGANLVRAYLVRADLTGADLTGADLTGADLTGADLTGADLIEANLQRANLQKANHEKAFLQGAKLQGANLQGANLSEANLSYSIPINLLEYNILLHKYTKFNNAIIDNLFFNDYISKFTNNVPEKITNKKQLKKQLEERKFTDN